MLFEQKVPFRTLTNSDTPSHFRLRARSDPKKWKFCSKMNFGRENAFWGKKRILGAKVIFLRKNAFFRPHVADAYKTNGILTKMEPFLAQSRFWGKKCVLGPKIDFWAQRAQNGPKMRFGAQKCVLRKSCQKVKVCLDLTDREPRFPVSRPDSIHGRPGLPELVAFSVPLHSNK